MWSIHSSTATAVARLQQRLCQLPRASAGDKGNVKAGSESSGAATGYFSQMATLGFILLTQGGWVHVISAACGQCPVICFLLQLP